jgi:hypothetical protein
MVRAGADFSGLYKEIKNSQKQMANFQKGISKNMSSFKNAISGALKIAAATFAMLGAGKVMKDALAVADYQAQQETKLATVMKQRMNATQGVIDSIKKLTAEQQSLGVIGDEAQLAGAQQLSTFLRTSDALKTLIPAMNNLAAQQKGVNATGEDLQSIANMMGKAMDGNATALRRVGISFSAAEEKILKYGNEQQRAAVLAKIIENNVGKMNIALASTPAGRMQQLRNSFGDLKETIGQAIMPLRNAFVPILTSAIQRLTVLAQAAQRTFAHIGALISSIFGSKQQQMQTDTKPLQAQSKALQGIADGYEDAGEAAKKASKGVQGFDEVHTIEDSDSSGTGAAGASAAVPALGEIQAFAPEIDASGVEQFGQKVEETAAKIKDALQPAAQAFEMLKKPVKELVDNIGQGLKWFYDKILQPFASWTISELMPAFFRLLAKAIELLNQAISILKPYGQWLWDKFLAPIASWTGGVIVEVLNRIADALGRVSDWIKNNQGFVENMIIVLGSFAAAWGLVTLALAAWNVVVGIWNILGAVSTAVTTAFGVAVNFLMSPITLVILAIGALIAVIILLIKHWDEVKAFALAVWGAIKAGWQAAAEWFNTNVVQPIATFFTSLWEGIKKAATGAWDWVKKTWQAVSAWFSTKVIQPVSNFFTGLWNEIKTAASSAWEGVKRVWQTVSAWFDKNVIQPVLGVFGNLKNGITNIWSGIWSGIKGVINSIIDGINGMINGLNSVKFSIPDWVPVLGGKSFGISIPNMPKLARGGIVDRPTVAMLGEQEPEAVVPLENTSFVDKLAAAVGNAVLQAMQVSSSGAQTANSAELVLQLDGVTLGRVALNNIDKELLRLGRKPLAIQTY